MTYCKYISLIFRYILPHKKSGAMNLCKFELFEHKNILVFLLSQSDSCKIIILPFVMPQKSSVCSQACCLNCLSHLDMAPTNYQPPIGGRASYNSACCGCLAIMCWLIILFVLVYQILLFIYRVPYGFSASLK